MGEAAKPLGGADAGVGQRAMVAVAFAFLVLVAIILPHGGLAETASNWLIAKPLSWVLLLILWVVVIAEGVAGFLTAPDRGGKARVRLALVCLVPPMRMTISPGRPNDAVWLPRLGWIPTGKRSVREMEERTGLPMLFMTALILPVIAADFLTGQNPHDRLSIEMEAARSYEVSDNGTRLFMLDGNERVLANVTRQGQETSTGINGAWIVLGSAPDNPRTILSLDEGGTFTLTTGCAVTEGDFSIVEGGLSFAEFERIKRCAPGPLEVVIWLVTAAIWLSFALEFILLVSLAEKKIEFCKKHWINLVIILLPLLAFLRSLQLFRFLRMAKAGRLMRIYRLRGLITRVAKLAMVFNLIERLLSRNPDKYGIHLREQISEKEDELADLRAKLAECDKRGSGAA